MRGALTQMFHSIDSDATAQPPQTLPLFPGGAGDFITYLGAMANASVFGAKRSPYLVTGSKPVVSAWSMLMSMETVQPLMFCEPTPLTTERTDGATSLAVDQLAPPDAATLAVAGAGAVGHAHLRHLRWDGRGVRFRCFRRNCRMTRQSAPRLPRSMSASPLALAWKTASAVPTWRRCAQRRVHPCCGKECSTSRRSLLRSAPMP